MLFGCGSNQTTSDSMAGGLSTTAIRRIASPLISASGCILWDQDQYDCGRITENNDRSLLLFNENIQVKPMLICEQHTVGSGGDFSAVARDTVSLNESSANIEVNMAILEGRLDARYVRVICVGRLLNDSYFTFTLQWQVEAMVSASP